MLVTPVLARAILNPKGLRSVRLLPYESKTTGFIPVGGLDEDLRRRVEALLTTWKEESLFDIFCMAHTCAKAWMTGFAG